MAPYGVRITGQDLDTWSESPEANALLPVLVRRLLGAQLPSGRGRVQFRADAGVRFAGYDGVTDLVEPVLDAPAGPAVWELSVNARPQGKAEEDHAKRTESPGDVSPPATAYVALTARHWPGKEAWAQQKRRAGPWRDVLALDADDLARWLEGSPGVAAWFAAEVLGRPVDQLAGPRALLEAWSERTSPPLPAGVLLAGREEEAARVRAWAQAGPSILPVRGESHDEALHFAAAALTEGAADEDLETRVVVARSTAALEWLLAARTPQPLLILAAFPEVEGRATSARAHHLLVAHARGERLVGRDYVELRPLPRAALATALEQVLDAGRAQREAWACGGSVGALQRALGHGTRPAWAAAGTLAPEVRATLLAGAWSPAAAGDRTLIERLSAKSADEVDAVCAALAADGAVRRKEGAWTWRSANDAWGLLAERLTAAHLVSLAERACEALEEEDPEAGRALEERLMLAVQGQRRRHSAALRTGVATSLALLATQPLPDVPLGPVQRRALVAHAVRRILTRPWQRWAALAPELPTLAEAAPEAFLEAVEESLGAGGAGVAGLFAVEQGGFGPSPHVHLLWALEALGWEPARLQRVAHALGRLAAVDPGGQMANRPERSLRALLDPLWPQTQATAAERLAALESLWGIAPQVAWKIALGLVSEPRGWVLFAAHRPAFLPGPPPPRPPETLRIDVSMVMGALDAVLSRAGGDPERWADVLERLARWPAELRARALETLLTRAEALRARDPAGRAWAAARQHLVHVLSATKYGRPHPPEEQALARRAYQALEPQDLVQRTAWLFATNPQAPEAAGLDWEALDACYSQLRRSALQPFLARAERGQLLRALLRVVPSAGVLGFALGQLDDNGLEGLVLGSGLEPGAERADVVRGFLVARYPLAGAQWLAAVLAGLVQQGRREEAARAAEGLVPGGALWDVLESVGEGLPEVYWGLGPRLYGALTVDERLRAVRALLAAGRPAPALEVVSQWEDKGGAHLPAHLVLEVLEALLAAPDALRALGERGMAGYHVSRALAHLGTLDGADLERAIRLEAFYLPGLDHFGGAPRLFRALAETPALFAAAVEAAYGDASERADPQAERSRRRAGHQVLERWDGVPAEEAPSGEREVLLERWCREVTTLLGARGLGDIGWHEVARVLARGDGDDGVWPCRVARRLLEEGAHPDLADYLRTAKRALRGVYTKGVMEGGEQERALAGEFRRDEAALRAQGFSRAAALVHSLAQRYEADAEREDVRAAELRDP